jgi:glutathione S-transferase
MLKLYTFNISHFAEKARWTLDYEGIAYEEKVLLPGPHQLVTRRIARRSHVPVLEHDGRYVQGSSAIMDYVADRLGGTRLALIDPAERAKVLELEKSLDHAFGRGVQQVLYSALLKDRRTVVDLWSSGGPFWGRGFYAIAFPAVASAVKRMYKTTDVGSVAEARQRFVTTFDELDAVLAKQLYLGGDTPNRSDITLAALLAPVCRVPEHRVKWPAMPPELADLEASLSGRPTWRHVLRMYRDHRKPNHSRAAGLAGAPAASNPDR